MSTPAPNVTDAPSRADSALATWTQEDATTQDLTIQDRCDACGAQAYVRVTIPLPEVTSELLFCGHHYTHEHQGALNTRAYKVHDERERLVEAYGAGSTVSA